VEVWELDVVGIVVAGMVQKTVNGIKSNSPAVSPVHLPRDKKY